jgi:hypothetical protein
MVKKTYTNIDALSGKKTLVAPKRFELSKHAIRRFTEMTANSPLGSADSSRPPVPSIGRRRGYEMEPHVPGGRKLYVVDAENIAGGSGADLRVAQERLDNIFTGVPLRAGTDHIVVACGITFAQTCLEVLLDHNWPKRPQILPIASGIDGADKRLIKHLHEVQRIASQYSQIIIASGDGIFQTAAISFRAVGVTVGVVSLLSALSNDLASAANWVVYIPETKYEMARRPVSA